ncbi:MAG: ABC transporter ATP-binding protein [Nitrospinota bacterium]|nr:ABC transporter ATP-binding protein [Nitrospinota bacterium]
MMLEIQGIDTYYGLSHVLHGVTMRVDEGEAIAFLGRNGAGKTTTLKSIMGLLKPRGGRVRFNGEDTTEMPVHEILRRGIGYIPEERRIFTNLTVDENLKMGRIVVDKGKNLRSFLDRMFSLFPRLEERRGFLGGSLSGGEQQMLTIARGLETEPKLLLVDEPTEGLMPELVERIRDSLEAIRQDGVAVVLVEQNTKLALGITQRAYLIEKGQIRYEGKSEDLMEDKETRLKYLGV